MNNFLWTKGKEMVSFFPMAKHHQPFEIKRENYQSVNFRSDEAIQFVFDFGCEQFGNKKVINNELRSCSTSLRGNFRYDK